MRNEGVSDPFPHRKRESQSLFPTAKGKPRTSPNPLSESPLSATHQIALPHFIFELSDPNRSDFETQIASDCNRNSKKSLRLRKHL